MRTWRRPGRRYYTFRVPVHGYRNRLVILRKISDIHSSTYKPAIEFNISFSLPRAQVYDSIREKPEYVKTDKKKHDKPGKEQPKKLHKLNAKQRQNRVAQKIKAHLEKKAAGKA